MSSTRPTGRRLVSFLGLPSSGSYEEVPYAFPGGNRQFMTSFVAKRLPIFLRARISPSSRPRSRRKPKARP